MFVPFVLIQHPFRLKFTHASSTVGDEHRGGLSWEWCCCPGLSMWCGEQMYYFREQVDGFGQKGNMGTLL